MSPVASACVAAPSLRSATFALVAVGDDASAMAARLCAAANLGRLAPPPRSAAHLSLKRRSLRGVRAPIEAQTPPDEDFPRRRACQARRSAAVDRGRRRDVPDAATFCFVDDFVGRPCARATRFAADVRRRAESLVIFRWVVGSTLARGANASLRASFRFGRARRRRDATGRRRETAKTPDPATRLPRRKRSPNRRYADTPNRPPE